ncbi:MATE family efflux transporter [Sphingomonas sanguinis]|uniref:MATE family efflux transporter n=1 Tax=Sphingomonas sp. LC-1 TaxID=3110957 RepID=UPI0021BAF08E|nr:MATE family efflux transporter [Sphingomonas sp. LC-1]MCT8000893.1 MATE family efflux transporter [Sphingomonas sp. LC-1]
MTSFLRPDRAEARRLLGLAWPVMLTSLNWTILHVTDVVVVGRVGEHEVAALSASRSLTYVAIVTGLAWLSGVLVRASRADGAGDWPETGQALRDGLVLGLILGIAAMLILGLGGSGLLRGIGVDPSLVEPGARVVAVMALGYPFQLVLVAASFFLEGISRPRRVTMVNLSILPINAALAWALAGGEMGLPALGAVGAALATVIASALGAVAMVASAMTLPRGALRGVRRMDRAAWAPTWRGAIGLARFGFVPAIASGLELAGFAILIALSTRLGDATAHGFQIVFSVHNVTFALALGLGSAAGVRAGNAVGEGVASAAIARTLLAVALAALAMAACGLVMLVGAGPLVGLFPAQADARAVAVAMLVIWAPFILFDGIQVVLVYALRSLGDQVAAGINSIIAYFIVTGGAGWWLVAHGWGAQGLAIASGAGMLIAALLHGARFGIVARRLWRA